MYRSDKELIRACLAGDEPSWCELVGRYSRLVYSIPLRKGYSQADADDIFQNVFAALFRCLGSVRNDKTLAAWLITTTVRECGALARSRRPDGELDPALLDEAPLPLEEMQRLERQQLMRQALDQLDPRCRELLTALFLDDDCGSYAEIARRLGMPVGSIGPNRARCFVRLREILAEMGADLAL